MASHRRGRQSRRRNGGDVSGCCYAFNKSSCVKWVAAVVVLVMLVNASMWLNPTPPASSPPNQRHVRGGNADDGPATMLWPASPSPARSDTTAHTPGSTTKQQHAQWPSWKPSKPQTGAPLAVPSVTPPEQSPSSHGQVPSPDPVVADDAVTHDDGSALSVDPRTEDVQLSDASAVAARDIAGTKGVTSDSGTRKNSDNRDVELVAIDPNMMKFLQAFPSLRQLPARYPIQDKFTVVMINYKRPAHLKWAVNRLSSCPSLHQIYVRVNSGRESLPNDVMSALERNDKVRVSFPRKNSLNNRFLYPPDMETEWALSIDDDMEVQAEEVEWAFRVAQQHPAQITGFFPRTIVGKPGSWRYVIPHLSKKGYKYNVVLTGSGTFFNSRWLHIYSEVQPKKIRDYVDEHFNCEDIAFNMMMSNATGLPPVLAVGSTHTTHSVQEAKTAHKGLRTRHGHSSGRSECIQHLVNVYKRNPLVDSDYMAVPFTFHVPALKQILKSTQIYTKTPTWWPKKDSKP